MLYDKKMASLKDKILEKDSQDKLGKKLCNKKVESNKKETKKYGKKKK